MDRSEWISQSERIAFLFAFSVFALFDVLVFCLLKGMESSLPRAIFSMLPFVLFEGIVLFLYYHTLLDVYRIDENGVENRFTKKTWDEIGRCALFYPEKHLKNLRTKPYPPMIVMGEIRTGSVFRQRKRDCVIVPLTQRNLQLIEQYWTNKSDEMREIIEQNPGFPDEPDKWVIGQ